MSYIDPNGKWFGIDDAIFSVGGAAIGVVGQFGSDLVTSVRTGHFAVSSLQSYTGAMIGGAVGGEATLYDANPVLSGAVGAAVANVVTQKLNVWTGRQGGFDYGNLAEATAVGATAGFIPGVGGVRGVTAGRGSMNAVFKQIVTKAENGTIKSVTVTTAGKMFIGSSVYAAGQTAGVAFGNGFVRDPAAVYGIGKDGALEEGGAPIQMAAFQVRASRK